MILKQSMRIALRCLFVVSLLILGLQAGMAQCVGCDECGIDASSITMNRVGCAAEFSVNAVITDPECEGCVLAYIWDIDNRLDLSNSASVTRFYDYLDGDPPSTYVCVSIYVIRPDGTSCVAEICQTFEIEDCDPYVECGGLEVGPIIMTGDGCTPEFSINAVLTDPGCVGCYIESYSWTFGDYSFAFGGFQAVTTSPSVTHTYNYTVDDPTEYEVCVEVLIIRPGDSPCRIKICQPFDIANCNPEDECDLEATLSTNRLGCVNEYTVDVSHHGDCEIVDYVWDFGDGTVIESTSSNVFHMYDNIPSNALGVRKVCVTIRMRDAQGRLFEKKICQNVGITSCDETTECLGCDVEASLSTNHLGCINEYTVNVTHHGQCEILGYGWNFGDDQVSYVSTSPFMAHKYDDIPPNVLAYAEVCVTIIMRDPFGEICHKRICQPVSLGRCEDTPPCTGCEVQGSISATNTGCINEYTVHATPSRLCRITGYIWEFGDGTGIGTTVPTASHQYEDPGDDPIDIQVCVTVIMEDALGNRCEERICEPVKVHPCDDCDCDLIPFFELDYTYQDFGVGCWAQYKAAPVFGLNSPCTIDSYHWTVVDPASANLNPFPVNGMDNFVWNHYLAGTYSVTLEVTASYNGICTTTRSVTQYIDIDCPDERRDVSGETDILDDSSLEYSVYPNPSSGIVFIEFGNEAEEQVEVSVIGTLGNVVAVLTSDSESRLSDYKLQWDSKAAGVAAGMYFVRIQKGDQMMHQKVIIE